MKRSSILNYCLFFSLLFFSQKAFSEDGKDNSSIPSIVQPEILVLEELISSTKSTLEVQENLLKIILAYQEIRSEFCIDSDNRKLANKLVKSASQIAEILTENHLAHLFPKNFLEEIDFFAALRNNPSTVSKS